MARTTWKRAERAAAKIIGGSRHPANVGGDIDVESDALVVQVKNRKTLSLAQMEALAIHIERVGQQNDKHGLLMVKRSAGPGRETPFLVIMHEAVFRSMNGRCRPMNQPE